MTWNFELVDGPYGGTTEGPAWNGSNLLFTYIPGSNIMEFNPRTGKSTIFRSETNHANGLMFDACGGLYACEGGGRRMVRYENDGSTTVLTDNFEGKRLNIPNDVAIDLQGRIWFTDPYYEGAGGKWSEDRANKELLHDSVYRLDQNNKEQWSITRVTFDTTRPNGLLFSLDHSILYIAESGRRPDEHRQLRAYPVNHDGSLGEYTMLHEFGDHRGIDGMVLDTEGNIVATAGFAQGGPGPMIYVFAPDGRILETHPMPVDRPTNCTFAGEDLTTLYVTTGEGYLFRARKERRGRLHYPKV